MKNFLGGAGKAIFILLPKGFCMFFEAQKREAFYS